MYETRCRCSSAAVSGRAEEALSARNRMNNIHPFINGNGRTARAASYFVLCVKAGGWLGGDPILPALIKRERPRYVAALKAADASFATGGEPNLGPLHTLLVDLLAEQMKSAVGFARFLPAISGAPPGSIQTPLHNLNRDHRREPRKGGPTGSHLPRPLLPPRSDLIQLADGVA